MRFLSVSFLFVAGIVNYLDRTSFSIANTSIRADLGLSPPGSEHYSPPSHWLMESHLPSA